MTIARRRFSRQSCAGFSLVEVAMAIGILGFVMLTMIGLLSGGLANFKQAMGNTIESQIVQSLSNDLLLENFSVLSTYAQATPSTQVYYYDNEGSQLPNSTHHVYQATITLTAVDNTNSPVTYYNSTATSPAAYNVTITIANVSDKTGYTQQHPHQYSLIIANNGL